MAFIACFSALPPIHLLLLHCVDNFDAMPLFCYVCFILVNGCSSRSSIGIVHSVRNLSRSLFVMALTAPQHLTSSQRTSKRQMARDGLMRKYAALIHQYEKVLHFIRNDSLDHILCMFEYQPSTLLKICDQTYCKILQITTKSSMVSADIMNTSSM